MSAFSLHRKGDSLNRGGYGKSGGRFFLLFVLLAFLLWPGGASARAAAGPQLNEQEAYVFKQVKEGRKADLAAEFGQEEAKRRLSAAFLKKLLMEDFKDFRIPHQGVHIAQAVITDGPLNLKYLDMDYPLTLAHCRFPDPVIFGDSHLTKDLSLAGSTFLKEADFSGMRVDGSVSCENAVFEGESIWSDAKTGDKFLADRAEFRSPVHRADFRSIRVGTEAYFSAAKFYGPVDFELAYIGVRLNMTKAEFFHKKEEAKFLAMIVDKYAVFNGARFHGPVSFVIVQVGLQFWANEAQFLHETELADFRGIKTGNSIYFEKAQFKGPARFEYAEIGANFRAKEAKFLNACQAKTFAQMKVGQKVYLEEVTICCDFDLSYGDFHDVEISGVVKPKEHVATSTMNLAKLNLTGAQVGRELKIANASIGELLAGNLQVKGPTHFINLEIRTLADFRHSSFDSLDFQKVAWPPKEKGKAVRRVWLSGMAYTSISIDKPADKDHSRDYDKKDFEAIGNFVADSYFNTQMYVQLEAFFKRIGREDWADNVYIRMHDRDLEENLRWYDPVRWLEWLFWGRLAGYGKKPFRVFFVSLALIILGACLFNPEHLSEHPKSTGGRRYRSMLLRIFISLDRFLPIELGLAKNWDAKSRGFLVWLYFHLQHILGWILIPIALASIYTQIK